MGQFFNVRCKCGYKTGVATGGGRATPHSCLFPVLCEDCQKLGSSDVYNPVPTCASCGSTKVLAYDAKELKQKEGEIILECCENRERAGEYHKLTDGNYYCPSCKEYTLIFENEGTIWC
jgi:Zn finger protein HypA/HybF involved in hydrogenase expression